MGTEGHQTKGQPARGREKPGRARGDGQRRAPDEGATGSRRENAGASPRGRPQKGTRRRSDGLAAGKSPGEPAEMGTEGHQTKGQPARGREKPGRARGDGQRRAPDEGATGSRRENAGASPRSRPQRAARGRSDGLASEQLSGKRTKRRMGFRLSEHFFASVTKTRRRGGRAKAKMHGQAGHDAGRRRQTQADGRPAERVSPISA